MPEITTAQATETSRLTLARLFIENTGKNLFLTGKAGTGKTTFLHHLQKACPKRMAIVAPTGVAAINAGGVTIHSFFQLPFGPQIPNHYLPQSEQKPETSFRFSREKLNILRSIDLLVIDEISMVRADMLDAIDGVLRRFRYRTKPFGGVQVLMIGDLQQLAPVVKDSDWQMLQAFYSGPFFFQSKVLESFPVETIELNHIFRQKDEKFIGVLNQIRENRLTAEGLAILQSRYIPNFTAPKGYITLTSHNRQSQQINQHHLDTLDARPLTFEASIEGDFPESSYPNDEKLVLKKGAQVMFIKNDGSREKLFYNGKIGTIESISPLKVSVRCTNPDLTIEVEHVEWQNYKYQLNETTNEIQEEIIGKFTQLPLKPAWAITIHKSQGLTFEHAIIDANAAFAHGQVYVALSRCRSLEGLVLSSPIDQRSIVSSQQVNSFIQQAASNAPTPERIQQFQREYEKELVLELFDFNILDRQLSRLHREIMQHRQVVFGAFPDQLNEVLLQFREKVLLVADKFRQQLLQLLASGLPATDHEALQERIQKAAPYFLKEVKVLMQPFVGNADLETDNKELRKTIGGQIDRILKSFTTHHDTLDACQQGFNISTYLAAKSVSNIEKTIKKAPAAKKPAGTGAGAATASAHPDLYQRLKQWRDIQADEHNWPHYLILQTKTMVELTNQLPASKKELQKISGLGKKKIEQFGKDLLEIIDTYRIDKSME
jgi:hypothetical protein